MAREQKKATLTCCVRRVWCVTLLPCLQSPHHQLRGRSCSKCTRLELESVGVKSSLPTWGSPAGRNKATGCHNGLFSRKIQKTRESCFSEELRNVFPGTVVFCLAVLPKEAWVGIVSLSAAEVALRKIHKSTNRRIFQFASEATAFHCVPSSVPP